MATVTQNGQLDLAELRRRFVALEAENERLRQQKAAASNGSKPFACTIQEKTWKDKKTNKPVTATLAVFSGGPRFIKSLGVDSLRVLVENVDVLEDAIAEYDAS